MALSLNQVKTSKSNKSRLALESLKVSNSEAFSSSRELEKRTPWSNTYINRSDEYNKLEVEPNSKLKVESSIFFEERDLNHYSRHEEGLLGVWCSVLSV